MVQKEVVTTDVDALLKLVESKKEISIQDAAKQLEMPETSVEAFADLLQEEGIITLKYKFTTPYLVFVSAGKAQEMRDEEKKQQQSFYVDKKVEDEEDVPAPEQDDDDMPEVLKKHGFGKETIEVKEPVKKEAKEALTDEQRQALDAQSKKKIVDTAEKLGTDKPVQEKVKDFNEAIVHVYEDMKQGKFDSAKELYGLITHHYEELPEQYEHEKDQIVDQLVELSKKLAINVDTFNENEFNESVAKITEIGRLCYTLIDKKSFREASQKFEELKLLYKKLPFGFIEKKAQLHDKLVRLHETFVQTKSKVFAKEMTRLSMITVKLIEKGYTALRKEDVDVASQVYIEIKKYQKEMPPGFVQRKVKIGEQVLEFYEDLAGVKAEVSTADFRDKKVLIDSYLQKAQSHIKQDDLGTAVEIFKRAKEAFISMPRGFLEEKAALQSQLFKLDKQLLKMRLDASHEEMSEKRAKIIRLLAIAQKYVSKDEPELAATVYDEILNIYNTLPDGYLEEKTKIKGKMLDIYKKSVLAADTLFLNEVDNKVQEHYNELLQLIIGAHKHVEERDFKALAQDYEYVSKVYEELPVGFIKKRLKIVDEITKLGVELDLLNKANELKSVRIDDYRRSEKILTEIYKLYDYLLKEAPEDKKLLDYVKEMSAPYTIKLIEKGKGKRTKHDLALHAKTIKQEKEKHDAKRELISKEVDENIRKSDERRKLLMQEKEQLKEELLEERNSALLEELDIEKEREALVGDQQLMWKKHEDLKNLMSLNDEVLEERAKLKKTQEAEKRKKSREEEIRKQIEKFKSEQQQEEKRIHLEQEKQQQELDKLQKMQFESKEEIGMINELERLRATHKKELEKTKKQASKIKKERIGVRKELAKLKKSKKKSSKKKLEQLKKQDDKLKNKLNRLLSSKDIGVTKKDISMEKKLLGKKVVEQVTPEEPYVPEVKFEAKIEEAPSAIDKEIEDLENELKKDSEQKVGLDDQQIRFDADLEAMEPEVLHGVHEELKEKKIMIKKVKEEKVKKEKPKKKSWLEKKELEIEEKLNLLNQGRSI
jgi:hypothetical protein